MRKINEERFFADYDLALQAKEVKLSSKEDAIRAEVEKAERVVAENGYSDAVKELLLAEIAKEKEAEFDVSKDDEVLASFEKYIDIVEDVVEEVCEEEIVNAEEASEAPEVPDVPVC